VLNSGRFFRSDVFDAQTINLHGCRIGPSGPGQRHRHQCANLFPAPQGPQDLQRIEVLARGHTQQIRHLDSDQRRYGWRLVDAPPSESWEYVNDKNHFLGTKRTGPDLGRVGGKYSSEWHWAHFKNPRDMGEKFRRQNIYQKASIMPSFAHLSDQEIKDLTAYIQTLGRNKNWRVDPKTGAPLNDYEK